MTLRTSTQAKPQLTIPRLSDILMEINAKRAEDVIRFRTCCADPRASK